MSFNITVEESIFTGDNNSDALAIIFNLICHGEYNKASIFFSLYEVSLELDNFDDESKLPNGVSFYAFCIMFIHDLAIHDHARSLFNYLLLLDNNNKNVDKFVNEMIINSFKFLKTDTSTVSDSTTAMCNCSSFFGFKFKAIDPKFFTITCDQNDVINGLHYLFDVTGDMKNNTLKYRFKNRIANIKIFDKLDKFIESRLIIRLAKYNISLADMIYNKVIESGRDDLAIYILIALPLTCFSKAMLESSIENQKVSNSISMIKGNGNVLRVGRDNGRHTLELRYDIINTLCENGRNVLLHDVSEEYENSNLDSFHAIFCDNMTKVFDTSAAAFHIKSYLTKSLTVLFPALSADAKLKCEIKLPDKSTKHWVCIKCTLRNPNDAQYCNVCQADKPPKKYNQLLLRQQAKEMNLIYLDPMLIQLKVRAQMIVEPTDIVNLVRQESLNHELTNQQKRLSIPGVSICFLCEGNGEIKIDNANEGSVLDDSDINLSDEPPPLEGVEKLPYDGILQDAMKAQDRDAIRIIMKSRDKPKAITTTQTAKDSNTLNELNKAIRTKDKIELIRMMNSKAGENAISKFSPIARENHLKLQEFDWKDFQSYCWYYSSNWSPIKEKLPYDGNLQDAMKAQDRDAIRSIMKSRKKPPVPIQNKKKDSSNISWIKFDDTQIERLLEKAYQDKNKNKLIKLEFMNEQAVNVRVNIDTMTMTSIDDKVTRKIMRQEIEFDNNVDSSERILLPKYQCCWLCRGEGKMSKWLEDTMLRDTVLSDSDKITTTISETPDCLICMSVPGKYGMSLECSHLFCTDCIRHSLSAMLEAGQFPAYCTQCRAESSGKQPTTGVIHRPVLTFLEERGVILKSFQYRFVTAMKRESRIDEASELMVCPAECGSHLFKSPPKFEAVNKKMMMRLCQCPCGAKICVSCGEIFEDDFYVHDCPKETIKAKMKESEMMTIKAIGNIGKKCPVCSMFIQKNDGCEWMMCGSSSHGSIKDALRNGGCGIAFNWNTMTVDDDPCGYKDIDGSSQRGRPVTARMLKEHPKCQREDCPYYACTDDIKIPKIVPDGGTQKRTEGGNYCCKSCKDGKGNNHSDLCHKIKYNDTGDIVTYKAEGLPIKYLLPFDATCIRIVFYKAHLLQFAKDSTHMILGHNNLHFQLEFLTTDDLIVEFDDVTVYNMKAQYGRFNDYSIVGDMWANDTPDEALVGEAVCEIKFKKRSRIKGIRSEIFHGVPFSLYYINYISETGGRTNKETATWIKYNVPYMNRSKSSKWEQERPLNKSVGGVGGVGRGKIDHRKQQSLPRYGRGGLSQRIAEAGSRYEIEDFTQFSKKVMTRFGKDISIWQPLLPKKYINMFVLLQNIFATTPHGIGAAHLELIRLAHFDRMYEKVFVDIIENKFALMNPMYYDIDLQKIGFKEYINKMKDDINKELDKNYLKLSSEMCQLGCEAFCTYIYHNNGVRALFTATNCEDEMHRYVLPDPRLALDAERRMILQILGNNGCQCPACGTVIEMNGGDDKMMCGCEARVAGGTLEKAIAGGGCGYEFDFNSGQPINDKCGKPGFPLNELQWKFMKDDDVNKRLDKERLKDKDPNEIINHAMTKFWPFVKEQLEYNSYGNAKK